MKASGTWSSALSTDEFAAIRSVGFEPVGQVLGAAVYNLGYRGGYGCPSYAYFGSYSRFGPGLAGYQGGTTSVSSSGSGASYAPLVETMYAARRAAIARMVAECAQLGGHGVVGVSLTIGSFAAGGLEFKAIGTAVRAPGAMPLKRPFTSDVSGQDFAKLIGDGVVPVGLALGISIGARHDDWVTRNQTSRWISGNTEVTGYTDLINKTRHDARDQLRRDVRELGAEGVVIQSIRNGGRRPGSGSARCEAREGSWPGQESKPAGITQPKEQHDRPEVSRFRGDGRTAGRDQAARGAGARQGRCHFHVGLVGQRVPAGPRGGFPPTRPGPRQLDLPRGPADRPVEQEPGARRAVPGHVPRQGTRDDQDGGRGQDARRRRGSRRPARRGIEGVRHRYRGVHRGRYGGKG